MKSNLPELPVWASMPGCAITVCDRNCRIIYMNPRSRDTFADGTDRLIGANLLECHSPRSREIIGRLLSDGGTNVYTIEKKGLRKLIYQSAWMGPDGRIGGLVELSMVIPAEMPHYIRQ